MSGTKSKKSYHVGFSFSSDLGAWQLLLSAILSLVTANVSKLFPDIKEQHSPRAGWLQIRTEHGEYSQWSAGGDDGVMDGDTGVGEEITKCS